MVPTSLPLQGHLIDPTEPHQLAYKSPKGPNSSPLRAVAHSPHVLSPIGSEKASLSHWPTAVPSGSESLGRAPRELRSSPPAPAAARHFTTTVPPSSGSTRAPRPTRAGNDRPLLTEPPGPTGRLFRPSLSRQKRAQRTLVCGCPLVHGPQITNDLEKKQNATETVCGLQSLRRFRSAAWSRTHRPCGRRRVERPELPSTACPRRFDGRSSPQEESGQRQDRKPPPITSSRGK